MDNQPINTIKARLAEIDKAIDKYEELNKIISNHKTTNAVDRNVLLPLINDLKELEMLKKKLFNQAKKCSRLLEAYLDTAKDNNG